MALAAGAALPLATHGLGGEAAGFSAGLAHPLGGLDHLLAMVAVGLWAAQQGGKAVWAIPLAFMAAMTAGGGLGLAAIPLPGVEFTILVSLMVLGSLVAFKRRPPVVLGMTIVAVLALFHGHAHGSELPEAASPILYAVGFLLASAILHAAGLVAAMVSERALATHGDRLVRMAGMAVATCGAVLLAG